jgi:hypothetical protein
VLQRRHSACRGTGFVPRSFRLNGLRPQERFIDSATAPNSLRTRVVRRKFGADSKEVRNVPSVGTFEGLRFLVGQTQQGVAKIYRQLATFRDFSNGGPQATVNRGARRNYMVEVGPPPCQDIQIWGNRVGVLAMEAARCPEGCKHLFSGSR